jgi:amidohydrolase
VEIHSNPELNFEEFKAHDNITAFLLSKGIEVTTHAFGLSTSFLAEYGTGGRVVTFCAEYDALPDIGHACGHNLIATSSIAAFFGVVEALRTSHVAGRVRLLGTPAEEGGGGKIKLIDAGAFKGTDAALMIHPTTPQANGDSGVAYGTCLASMGTTAVFRGQGTHAGSTPWLGVNALDAAVLSYSAIGMLRQQIRPDDRINLIIKAKEDSRVNIIAESSAVDCNIRCPTFAEVRALKERVMRCFSGAAIATGCSVELTDR